MAAKYWSLSIEKKKVIRNGNYSFKIFLSHNCNGFAYLWEIVLAKHFYMSGFSSEMNSFL